MAKKLSYEEIAKAKISDTRNVVVSKCSAGGYTIAQQISVTEGEDNGITMFIKGAFHIDDLNGFYNLKDALTVAINEIEKDNKVEDDGWSKY